EHRSSESTWTLLGWPYRRPNICPCTRKRLAARDEATVSNSPRSRGGSRQLAGLSVAAALLASLVAVLSAPASALAEPGVGAVAWGDNSAAQLGAGYKNPFEESPVSVLGLSNVASVALGYHLSVALLGDGTVRTWGGNVYGQLGDKTHVASGSP